MTTMTPSISIVVPVHDGAAVTRRCLDVLVAQTGGDDAVEVIVVDDGSTDDTAGLLAGYAGRIRTVRRPQNGGFAQACNDGADAARGDRLVFLNNDTTPVVGWLGALVAHAETHPAAGVVGGRLLHHDGTVQHAGVAICQDGLPRHIYAGFPGDHPAVLRSRRFQAVTAACALVPRPAFERAGGFDTAYRNGLEDVDLCLRLGELGYEIRYCADSVIYHLESASRDRRAPEVGANEELYRSRWAGRVRADDVDHYLEDGLLRFAYEDSYPVGVAVSPRLATPVRPDQETADVLNGLSRKVLALLRETARLSVAPLARAGDGADPVAPEGAALGADLGPYPQVLSLARGIEAALDDLQHAVAATSCSGSSRDAAGAPSAYLGYRKLVERFRAAINASVPPGATVLVVSRGDDELLAVGSDRRAWHFPRDGAGGYAGCYPPDDDAAVAHLEELFEQGAGYIAIPSTSLWWLDHYPALARRLEGGHRPSWREPDTGAIFELTVADRLGPDLVASAAP